MSFTILLNSNKQPNIINVNSARNKYTWTNNPANMTITKIMAVKERVLKVWIFSDKFFISKVSKLIQSN